MTNYQIIWGLKLPVWAIEKREGMAHRCWSQFMTHKQRFLTPGHQGWNDLHSLCRIGMEYYLLNNDDNNDNDDDDNNNDNNDDDDDNRNSNNNDNDYNHNNDTNNDNNENDNDKNSSDSMPVTV